MQFSSLWPHIFIFHFDSQTEPSPASHFRCWKPNWNSASHQPPIFSIYKKCYFLLSGLTFSYFTSIPKLSTPQPHLLGVESKTETQPPISLPFSEFTKKYNFVLSGLTFSYFTSIPKLSSFQPHILGVESKTKTQPPISLPFSEFTKNPIFSSLASHFHISLRFPNWAVSSLTF